MTGLDGLKVEDLTAPSSKAASASHALVDYVRAKMPGFAQLLRRRRRAADRHPPDPPAGRRICRHQGGRDRARALRRQRRARPRLLHAVSRDAAARRRGPARRRPALFGDLAAQKMSREIPPCMAMGEAAGVAAALALAAGVRGRRRRCRQAAARGCARRAPIRATGRRPMRSVLRGRGMSIAANAQPLAGIKVIDFTQVMMGPCCHADARPTTAPT